MYFCARLSNFLNFLLPPSSEFQSDGSSRTYTLAVKPLRHVLDPHMYRPLSQVSFFYSTSEHAASTKQRHRTPFPDIYRLDPSPCLSHLNNIRSHCEIHLTISLSNQNSSVVFRLSVPSVRFCNIRNLRAAVCQSSDSDFDYEVTNCGHSLAVIRDLRVVSLHVMAATHDQIVHVTMVISLTECNSGTTQ